MRTDPRYTRVRAMLMDEAVPRLPGGGIALCHLCQRSLYFAGGFLQLLLRKLKQTAQEMFAPGHCPRCGHHRLYVIQRYDRRRCAECGFDFTPNDGSAVYRRKKSFLWYSEVLALHAQGLNPHAISKRLGMKDSKSVYQFIGRMKMCDRGDGDERTGH